MRARAQLECEQFIEKCTTLGTSFAVETTLRTSVAIDQAERARTAGFVIKLIFVATDDVQSNILRVVRRGLDGGHSAPVARIVETYQRSLSNLGRALSVFDEVVLYDSTAHDRPPRLVRIYHDQCITFEDPPVPAWLAAMVDDR